MTNFAVTVPAVAQAAAGTDTIACELRAELEALRRETGAVLAGDWLGRAAGAFDAAWTQWHADAQAVIAALDELAASLGDSATAYATCDADGSERLQLAMP